ncbi:MAG: CoA pyrophosphatase [Paracoccaceae bacterium]
MTPDLLDLVRLAIGRTSDRSSDFDLSPDVDLSSDRKSRPCGVLIPLINGKDGLEVILTKRSSALKHHPGQIAFPGGKVDAGDDGPIAAALREAEEEIGLSAANVEVLGTLSSHETVTGYIITPVIGLVRAAFAARPEPGEVEEVFHVPLRHVTDIAQFQIQSRNWRGVQRQYYTVPHGPYYIWGATARILRGLAERMAQ